MAYVHCHTRPLGANPVGAPENSIMGRNALSSLLVMVFNPQRVRVSPSGEMMPRCEPYVEWARREAEREVSALFSGEDFAPTTPVRELPLPLPRGGSVMTKADPREDTRPREDYA